MNSTLPKVLHPVAGRPMIRRTLEVVKSVTDGEIRCVLGYGENLIRPLVEGLGAQVFLQPKQMGTAHAVLCAQPDSLRGHVVILNGDHPLLEKEDLEVFVGTAMKENYDLAVGTCHLGEPGAFGRIVRSAGSIKAIVEAKDASHETRRITEVNTGLYFARADVLSRLLPEVHPHNEQNEFYLTDMVSLAVEKGIKTEGLIVSERLAFGVNTQRELAEANRILYRKKINDLLDSGVIVMAPDSTYVEETVEVASGTLLYPGVILRGRTQIGHLCVIEAGTVIRDAQLADNVHVKANSYLQECRVGRESEIGPFAHLRPQTEIGEQCKVGNFVEMKKVKFGRGAKASHLTYLGDAEVGERTNIGCGVITCNYAPDKKKYVTKIGRDVFVGSDSQFVAPISVGDGAVIGSGSTITKNVPGRSLAVARGKQVIKENYVPKSLSDGPAKDE